MSWCIYLKKINKKKIKKTTVWFLGIHLKDSEKYGWYSFFPLTSWVWVELIMIPLQRLKLISDGNWKVLWKINIEVSRIKEFCKIFLNTSVIFRHVSIMENFKLKIWAWCNSGTKSSDLGLLWKFKSGTRDPVKFKSDTLNPLKT